MSQIRVHLQLLTAFLVLTLLITGCSRTGQTDPQEITYILEEKSVRFDEITIPFYLIDNIRDVNPIPKAVLVEGVEDGDYKKGLFDVNGYGLIHLYVQDANRRMLLIEHDGEQYGITPGTGETFDQFRYDLIVAWELTYK